MNCNREWQDDRGTDFLKGWILRKLGCNVISVELEDEQLEDAIREAQEYWLMWVGSTKHVVLNVSKFEYEASEIAPDIDSVVDIIWDTVDTSFRDLFAWADVEINPYQQVLGRNRGMSWILQYQQYREDAKRVFSADKDWMWDRERRVLVLSPATTSVQKVAVIYLSRCFDYAKLSTYEWKLFRDYALCMAMMTLAFIRMKFPDKPSATGTFTMDGEAMWANAEALKMQIEEKMRQMQRPCGIFTG